MYIANLSKDVKEIFEMLEKEGDKNRIKFLLYIFNNISNNLINNKNTITPNIDEDEELEVLTFEIMGLTYIGEAILEVITAVHNSYFRNEGVLEVECGLVKGIKYNKKIKSIITLFEKLSYIDKLDFIRELIIRYDNETYFKEIRLLPLLVKKSGYDIARDIEKYKEKI